MLESNAANLDLWRVHLPSGEVRAMSLDELDAAFNADAIGPRTLVVEPGTTEWVALGQILGLEVEPEAPTSREFGSDLVSLAPLAVSVAPAASSMDAPFVGLDDLDDIDPSAFRSKKKRGVVVGLCAAIALVIAATALVKRADAETNTDTKSNAASAAPPPAAADLSKVGTPVEPSIKLTDEQKRALLDGDKAREVHAQQKAAARPPTKRAGAPQRAGASGKNKGPLLQGGDKYDPLNGSL